MVVILLAFAGGAQLALRLARATDAEDEAARPKGNGLFGSEAKAKRAG